MSPTFLSFHTHYWEFTDSNVTPVAISHGGYPAWQSTPHGVTIGASLFGWPAAVPALVRRAWATLGFLWALVRIGWGVPAKARPRVLQTLPGLVALDGERAAVVDRTLRVVQAPVYAYASAGVRQTATTLGFNQPQAWVQLSHTLKDHAGWAENTWRHLQACHLTDQAVRAQGSTLTNRDRHFAVALAFEGFAANPRGRL